MEDAQTGVAPGRVSAGRLASGLILGPAGAALAAAVALGLGLLVSWLVNGVVAFLESLPRLFLVIMLILALVSIFLPYVILFAMYCAAGAIAASIVRHCTAGSRRGEGRVVRLATYVAAICTVPLVFVIGQQVQPHLPETNYLSRMLLAAFGRGFVGTWSGWTWANLVAAVALVVWIARMPADA